MTSSIVLECHIKMYKAYNQPPPRTYKKWVGLNSKIGSWLLGVPHYCRGVLAQSCRMATCVCQCQVAHGWPRLGPLEDLTADTATCHGKQGASRWVGVKASYEKLGSLVPWCRGSNPWPNEARIAAETAKTGDLASHRCLSIWCRQCRVEITAICSILWT